MWYICCLHLGPNTISKMCMCRPLREADLQPSVLLWTVVQRFLTGFRPCSFPLHHWRRLMAHIPPSLPTDALSYILWHPQMEWQGTSHTQKGSLTCRASCWLSQFWALWLVPWKLVSFSLLKRPDWLSEGAWGGNGPSTYTFEGVGGPASPRNHLALGTDLIRILAQ